MSPSDTRPAERTEATRAARHLVSVVLSFRNEEGVLPELCRRLEASLEPLPLDYEVIFVNDSSTDGSLRLLKELAQRDRRIKVVTMSRRFGVAECVLAGMRYAKGDAVVMMDADLQDPPELIPELVEKWLQQRADVVYTIRTARTGESSFKLWLTRMAYRVIHWVASTDLPVEAGDFRLIARRVCDELLRLNEKDPYLRGLVRWVGFKQVPVSYERQQRFSGESHFPIFRSRGPLATFVSAITSFSIVPLAAFVVLGLLVCGASIAAIPFMVLSRALAWGDPGWSFGTVALFLLGGAQLLGIGVVGLYVGRVYDDVRNRPHYIVESTFGFDEHAS